jgi:L-alanine-DL-glutamate epimerase-like enolase superfamily enzyme
MREIGLSRTRIVGASVMRSAPQSPGDVPRVAILEILDSVGIVGRAAVPVDDAVLAELGRWIPLLMGSAPFASADRWSAFQALRGISGTGPAWQAFSAGESALEDLCAHRVGVPLHKWLGGKVRDTIPVALVLDVGTRSPDCIVAQADRAVWVHGCRALTVQTEAAECATAVQALTLLRARFGDAIGLRLRLAPPAGLTPAELAALHTAVAPLHLDYIQDDIGIPDLHAPPFAVTPRCIGNAVTDVGQLAAAVRSGAMLVLALDPLAWGGAVGIPRLGAVCRAFHLELALSCAGVGPYGFALAVHLAAALPSATMGIECYPTDLRVGFPLSEGMVRVPDTPGLGAEAPGETEPGGSLLVIDDQPAAQGPGVLSA